MRRAVKVLVIVVAIALLTSLAIQAVYAKKALPNVEVGGLNVGGKSQTDIAQLVKDKAPQELKFTYQNTTFVVPADAIELSYNPDATAKAAVEAGRSSLADKVVKPVTSLVSTTEVVPVYSYNANALNARIKAQTERLSKPAINANVVLTNGTFRITPERDGSGIEPQAGVAAAQDSMNTFSDQVKLVATAQKPTVTKQELTPARAYAELLSSEPLKVTARGKSVTVDPETIQDWITFRTVDNADVPSVLKDNLIASVNAYWGVSSSGAIGSALDTQTVVAEPDRVPIGQYVANVAGQVDSPPVNARLAFVNNQVQISGAPQDGIVVQRPEAVGAIQKALKESDRTAELPVAGKPADIRQETLDSLGIKTLIGKSTTNFPGSPPGRTFNIGVGASKFNGVLIKPGEEFSFNKVLGDVGPETGYVPELVILEKTTEKQYGGGLCQVSTTMFRAAMDAGLPITDRSNHSYAVSYYAPIGMDATIYPPDPDMKFINNSPGYILVQTAQSGQSVTFEFYGTSDGRTSNTEVMYINATEANGGTAAFRYTVSGGPQPIDRVFTSTYKPHSAFPIANSLN